MAKKENSGGEGGRGLVGKRAPRGVKLAGAKANRIVGDSPARASSSGGASRPARREGRPGELWLVSGSELIRPWAAKPGAGSRGGPVEGSLLESKGKAEWLSSANDPLMEDPPGRA